MQYLIAGSLARKCKIILWFPCGADRWSSGRTVRWLPEFLGWIDNQFFSYGAPFALYEYYLNTKKWPLNTVWAQRTHTFSVCNRLFFFFMVNVLDLPFAWAIAIYWKTWQKPETASKKSLTPRVRRSHFSPENRIAPLSSFAGKMSKDSRFFSYLPIENPSKRPEASPPRKLKSHSFLTVKMRSKILMCQPQTVPLIASFWLADWPVKISSKIHTCQSETVLLIASVLIGYR